MYELHFISPCSIDILCSWYPSISLTQYLSLFRSFAVSPFRMFAPSFISPFVFRVFTLSRFALLPYHLFAFFLIALLPFCLFDFLHFLLFSLLAFCILNHCSIDEDFLVLLIFSSNALILFANTPISPFFFRYFPLPASLPLSLLLSLTLCNFSLSFF